LTKKVLSSTISERQAEQEVIKFVKKHVGNENPQLAGTLFTSTCQIWLLFSLMYLSMSVVSSLYAPDGFPEHLDKNRAPAKKNNHRAMDDIRESIKELKYYKETIFKANKDISSILRFIFFQWIPSDLGLTKKVLSSTISDRQAEQEVIKIVKKHVGNENPQLAGNSVYVDFLFLKVSRKF
ncbi:hypothetical protein F2Q70_00000140, partial [Brassica cretica]